MRLCYYGKLLCRAEGSALHSVIRVGQPLSVISVSAYMYGRPVSNRLLEKHTS